MSRLNLVQLSSSLQQSTLQSYNLGLQPIKMKSIPLADISVLCDWNNAIKLYGSLVLV